MTTYEGIKSFYDYRKVTAAQLTEDAKKLISDCKAVYDQVAGVDATNVSYATVIKPLLDVDTDSTHRGVALQLPGMVATDKELR